MSLIGTFSLSVLGVRPMAVPLIGQGIPLPTHFPFEGEWLHENELFLYRIDHANDAEFTAGFLSADCERCVGVNAAVLASLLELGIDEVYEHNRNGTLLLDNIHHGYLPQREDAVAAVFVFRINTRFAGLVFDGSKSLKLQCVTAAPIHSRSGDTELRSVSLASG
jgi:hypothetical protein